jgi:membrane fusion protein, heavy metal efflux system
MKLPNVETNEPDIESRPAVSSPARRRWLIVVVLGLVLVTAAVVLWRVRGSLRGDGVEAGRPVPAPTFEGSPAAEEGVAPRPGDVLITLSPEESANAQIKTEPASAPESGQAVTTGVRTTGVVQSNAYKEVPVFAIAGGTMRQVMREAGDRVARGQKLATIFSSELADAQAAYLRLFAEQEEHHEHYKRTVELLEIGAVSREELERVTSMHKTAEANLEAAKQRLILLGMNEKQIEGLVTSAASALITVESPSSGTILSRSVNPDEVVMAGKELFRVADLSTVWVIGQVYDRDFAAVRMGTHASITSPAYPGRVFRGKVSYVDPQVDLKTRTAEVRIEVANRGEALKLGMYLDVVFGETAAPAGTGQVVAGVSSQALQSIGAKQVVFLATGQPGVFVQREVKTGGEADGSVAIYSGLSPGERVVTEGSFLLRAQSLKLNSDQGAVSEASHQHESSVIATPDGTGVQSATIVLTANGFEPDNIVLKAGRQARITFLRKVEETCATEVVIPAFGIKEELPLNQATSVEFMPEKKGEYEFMCGMAMLRGKIIVK